MAKGKIIDTLEVDHQGTQLKVPIRMLKDDSTTLFVIDHKSQQPPVEVRLHNPNIDQLRREAAQEIRKQLQLHWTQWLYVTCRGRGTETDEVECRSRMLEVSWQVYQTAKSADGKADLYRKINEDVSEGHPYRADRITVGKLHVGLSDDDMGWNRDDRVGKRMDALIPDTPENRDALANIQARMATLQRRMMDLLSPEKIEGNLLSIAERILPQLPAPEPTSPPRKKV